MTSPRVRTSRQTWTGEGGRGWTLQGVLPSGSRLDQIGAALVLIAVGWTLANQAAPLGARLVASGVFLATAGAYATARLAARLDPRLIPAVIVSTTLLLAIVSWDDVLGSEPLADPLGYENANAALILQATVGSLMLLKMGRRSALRAMGFTAAVGFGGLTLLVGSVAGDVLLALAAATVFPRRPEAARGTVLACAVLLVFALMVTVGLGATFDNGARSGSIDRVADAAFSERRVALWHDALVIIGQRPGIGVGAGQFWLHSPVGRSDRDARWAHQEFLQHGAEAGVVGFLLLVCMFGWALGRLLVVPSPNTLVALGAGSVAILGIHACVDYVLHFVVLPISAAALLGTAVGNGSIEARR